MRLPVFVKTSAVLILLICSLFSARVEAATVSGTVLDSTTLEPVPYASVLLLGTDRGALTDEFGHFSVTTAVKTDSIRVGAMGYETQTLYLPPSSTGKSIVNVKLRPIGVQLDNVTARRTREHYSKKDNPAVKFMESIRASATLTDPRHTKSNYNYDKYERISLAINDFQSAIDTASGKSPGQFDFVHEYIDTSEITGKPILNLSVREKVSQIHYRRSPEAEKEYVKAIQSAGIDEFIDRASLQRLYEDVMREIDVYQNDITLLQQRFVSPLSSIAPDFYKFYLSDTVNVDSVRCVELTFVPRNAASMGFTGRFYVPLGDSTMFIKRIIMRVPHDINLNFITSMLVTQDYTRLHDGTRLKTKDDMTLEAQIMPGTPGIYARRKSIYAGHNFCQPADSAIFNRGLAQIYAPDAYAKDDAYWESARLGKISYGEKNMRELMSGMRSVKLYYWGEKIIRIIAKGYIPTGRNSRFDIGPITSTFSLNNIEGLRLRLGGITTANLSKRWFGRGYVAYGFKDHKWKYSAEAEYSFLDKEYHSREFPVHSIRLTHLYDMKMLGQTFTTNNQDNMFMSFRRGENVQMIYHRVTKLDYTLEMENNLTIKARLQSERQEPTRWMPFVDGRGSALSHYTTNSLNIELRYAPGEKIYQLTTGRLPINMDAPVFSLSHRWAPKGVAGNKYTLSITEASVSKRFWFSAFGYIDAIAKGGHCWTSTPYPDLLIPNANLSYFNQAETFALMNPMEFINDSYAQLDLTYWANGALLNLVPYLKRLKLREALIFRGLYGHLSHRNRPWNNPELLKFPEIANPTLMSATPYLEAGVGVDNLFKILRVDYLWRLTYRHTPGACRGGVRFLVHFSF